MPETTGAAKDVPDIHRLFGATTRSGNCESRFAPVGTAPTILRPGAATSGLKKPSWVEPQADQGAAEVVAAARGVVRVRRADGDHEGVVGRCEADLATGAVRPRSCRPQTTTTTPFSHSRSTARSSASYWTLSPPVSSEKLATRMLYCALFARIQSQAAITSLFEPLPEPSSTLIETIFARGSAPP